MIHEVLSYKHSKIKRMILEKAHVLYYFFPFSLLFYDEVSKHLYVFSSCVFSYFQISILAASTSAAGMCLMK